MDSQNKSKSGGQESSKYTYDILIKQYDGVNKVQSKFQLKIPKGKINFKEFYQEIIRNLHLSPFISFYFIDSLTNLKFEYKQMDFIYLKKDCDNEFTIRITNKCDICFNATPEDLIKKYEEIYNSTNDKQEKPRIFFEIPKQFYQTPLNRITFKEILSNITFLDEKGTCNDVSSFPFNPYIFDQKDDIKNFFDQKMSIQSNQNNYKIYLRGQDFNEVIEMDGYSMTGSVITDKVKKFIFSQQKDWEIDSIFIKTNKSIEKINPEKIYYLKYSVTNSKTESVELLFTRKIKRRDFYPDDI